MIFGPWIYVNSMNRPVDWLKMQMIYLQRFQILLQMNRLECTFNLFQKFKVPLMSDFDQILPACGKHSY